MKVASIGECMIEFSQTPDGAFRRGFGGDTLNTALYLSRLGIDASYVTALGDDALSDAMLASWQSEGIRIGRHIDAGVATKQATTRATRPALPRAFTSALQLM